MRTKFEIVPVQQKRPRVTTICGRPRVYDKKEVKEFKKELANLAKTYMGMNLIEKFEEKPLKVVVEFGRPVQKSISAKERERRLSGEVLPTVKPDLDNYIKSALDALNGVVWDDDRFIVDIHAKKVYAENGYIKIKVVEVR